MAKGKVTLTDAEKATIKSQRESLANIKLYQAVRDGCASTIKEQEAGEAGRDPYRTILFTSFYGSSAQTPRFWTKKEIGDLIRAEFPKDANAARAYHGLGEAVKSNSVDVVIVDELVTKPCNPAWDFDSRDLVAVCEWVRKYAPLIISITALVVALWR